MSKPIRLGCNGKKLWRYLMKDIERNMKAIREHVVKTQENVKRMNEIISLIASRRK